MGIDLEQPLRERHKAAVGLNPLVNTSDGGNEALETVGGNICNVFCYEIERSEPNVTQMLHECMQEGYLGEGTNRENIEPHDGMEFESKEDAFAFYRDYAKLVGFSAIIKASRRSRVSGKFIDAKFACTRYGNTPDSAAHASVEASSAADSVAVPVKKQRGRTNRSWSKTNCKACMHVKRRQDGRWVVHSFIKEHNHGICSHQGYDFRGHRNLALTHGGGEIFTGIGARTKKMYVSMSKQYGGCKKPGKQRRHNPDQSDTHQNLRIDGGDVQLMLDYFIEMQKENPNFFYAIDLNQEHCLRNVFWVDAKGRLNYGHFGDVVLFDTIYIKNEFKLPFAPLIGVNHHFQPLLLGCALLADETKQTYVWLMRAWLRAMGGHAPVVILTDQDKALKEAVAEVLPDSHHCFCLWHILSKVPEKLSYVMRQQGSFVKKFKKCVLESCTAEQFEKRWKKIIDRFNLGNDSWFLSLYEDRMRWIPSYMRNIFLGGMSTAQRSDCMSSFLDKYVPRRTTLGEFLEHYKNIMQEMCEEEAKADCESWDKQPGLKSPSPFGKQLADMYTHAIFKKFQVEVLGVVACHPRKESEDGIIKSFKVQDFEANRDLTVVWNEKTSDLSCSCHSFEFNGFLCRHVMVVLQMSGVQSIPAQYILNRWTKYAKNRLLVRRDTPILLSRVQRYNNLCEHSFELSDEGSFSQESYKMALKALEEALKKCESINSSGYSMNHAISPPRDEHHLHR